MRKSLIYLLILIIYQMVSGASLFEAEAPNSVIEVQKESFEESYDTISS